MGGRGESEVEQTAQLGPTSERTGNMNLHEQKAAPQWVSSAIEGNMQPEKATKEGQIAHKCGTEGKQRSTNRISLPGTRL